MSPVDDADQQAIDHLGQYFDYTIPRDGVEHVLDLVRKEPGMARAIRDCVVYRVGEQVAAERYGLTVTAVTDRHQEVMRRLSTVALRASAERPR